MRSLMITDSLVWIAIGTLHDNLVWDGPDSFIASIDLVSLLLVVVSLDKTSPPVSYDVKSINCDRLVLSSILTTEVDTSGLSFLNLVEID